MGEWVSGCGCVGGYGCGQCGVRVGWEWPGGGQWMGEAVSGGLVGLVVGAAVHGWWIRMALILKVY